MIDWESRETHFLSNARLDLVQKSRLEQAQHELPDLPGHIWILTSGSTSSVQLKWVALSKQAFLTSAAAVNQHLEVTGSDVWLLSLPVFHVGGLSIFARAHLSKSRVVEFQQNWSAASFFKTLQDEKITLTSLVPTQLYDLVQHGQPCPKFLRALVVGGGSLSSDLYFRARELGYPVLPSYGLTECASQVATASLSSLNQSASPDLAPLSHVRLRSNEHGHLEIQSESLFTGMAYISPNDVEYLDPKVDSWYTTEDLGFLENGFVHVQGRRQDQVKVSGELVFLPRLQQIFAQWWPDSVIVAVPDERKQHALAAVLTLKDLGPSVPLSVAEFNRQVAPYERISQIYYLRDIPRTELGKVRVRWIKDKLGLPE